MRYLNIVPLIGGMTIANQQVTGEDPLAILSYTPFQSNDSHIVARNPHIPYLFLDEDCPEEGCYDVPGDIDFVSTVCPCAGMSMYSSGKKGHGAAQNEWMYKTANYVLENVQPKVFFGENAPGLYTAMGKAVANDLNQIAKDHGYTFSIYRTNTNLHGIPQSRVRTFYFYWKADEAPEMAWYASPKLSLPEYLAQVPEGALYHSEEDKAAKKAQIESDYTWAWLVDTFGSKEARRLMKEGSYLSIFDFADSEGHLPQMVSWLEARGYEKGAKRTKAIMEKVQAGGNYWDNSVYVFSEEFNALIGRSMDSAHPVEDRAITLREGMHLMGLPHDFKLTDDKLGNHITQNVPVCTAADMTREVVKFCNGELPGSGCTFYKQDNTSRSFEEVERKSSLEEFFV